MLPHKTQQHEIALLCLCQQLTHILCADILAPAEQTQRVDVSFAENHISHLHLHSCGGGGRGPGAPPPNTGVGRGPAPPGGG